MASVGGQQWYCVTVLVLSVDDWLGSEIYLVECLLVLLNRIFGLSHGVIRLSNQAVCVDMSSRSVTQSRHYRDVAGVAIRANSERVIQRWS